MFATSMRGSTWPARLSYLAAGLFTFASAGTNLIYGWSKGSDTATSLVWAAVSIAVSAVFALSWPALIVSLDRKLWSRATMAFIALLLTGAYSVSAALGSAMGGRANSANEQKDISDKRTKAQASYDAAAAELATLKSSRPAAEVEALVEAAKPQCRIVVSNGYRGESCSKPPTLTAELGRAKRRVDLEQKIEQATADLATTGPAKLANSDAVALAAYLQGLGLSVDADRVNKLLVLLAVLCIECGGGLALMVGMALSDREPPAGQTHDAGGSLPVAFPMPPAINTLPVSPQFAHTVPAIMRAGTLPSTPGSGARERLLGMLDSGQGVVRGCQAEIGRALGVSRARVRQLLADLAAAGAIKVRTSSTGTVISLVAPIAPCASVH